MTTMKELVDAINSAVSDAEAYADEHGVCFTIDIAYGMGGTYDGEEGQWYPSSESC